MNKLYLVRQTQDLGKPVDPFDFQSVYPTREEAEQHLATKGFPTMGREFSIEELDPWWMGATE